MAHVRIISIENPRALHVHSKFIRRREYVENELLPYLKTLPFDSADIFRAITGWDYVREGNIVRYQDVQLQIGVGCLGNFLSNYMLWQLAITLNSAILILEDDALLPKQNADNVLAAINDYEKLPDNGDILYLLSESPSAANELKSYHKSHLGERINSLQRLKTTNDLSCTAAYCVRPKSAQCLVAEAQVEGTAATDGFIHRLFNRRGIGVLLPTAYERGFMLHDNFAEWNLKHIPY
jgi:GR25 family glycosyltransferase involved in LPS biosynthesis